MAKKEIAVKKSVVERVRSEVMRAEGAAKSDSDAITEDEIRRDD